MSTRFIGVPEAPQEPTISASIEPLAKERAKPPELRQIAAAVADLYRPLARGILGQLGRPLQLPA